MVLHGHEGPVNEVTRVPGKPWVASVGDDSTIRIWNVDAGRALAMLTGADGDLHAVAVSPDGRYLAAGTNLVGLWDLQERRRLRILDRHATTVESLAFSPDGKLLAIGSRYGAISVVSIPDGSVAARHIGDSRNEALAFLPDGHSLICPERTNGVDFLEIWDVSSQEISKAIKPPHGSLRMTAVSHDGRWLAASSEYDSRIQIYDVRSDQLVFVVPRAGDAVKAICLSPDDSLLAAAYVDGTVRCWSVATASRLDQPSEQASQVRVDLDSVWAVKADPTKLCSVTFTRP